MNNDPISDLFKDFNPPLSSSPQEFMDRLNRNLDAVDIIKKRSCNVIRRYRFAAFVAFFVGCFVGGVLTLMLPSIVNFISSIYFFESLSISFAQIVAWILIASMTLLSAFSSFSFSMIAKK